MPAGRLSPTSLTARLLALVAALSSMAFLALTRAKRAGATLWIAAFAALLIVATLYLTRLA